MAGNAHHAGESVASKIFSVLDAFAGERSELTAHEISHLTGIPQSTLNRLVRGLISWGGIERTERGTYRVGIKLWEVAARVPMSNDLRSAALPFMQNLIRLTHANAGLGTLDGHEALIFEKVSNPRGFASVGRIGGRVPLHASAMGKVMLAFGPDELREEILQQPLARFTPRTTTDPRALRTEIVQVKLQQFAVAKEEIRAGEMSVAAPIFDERSKMLAALSAIVPAGYGQMRELTSAVRSCANGISQVWAANRTSTSPWSVTPRTLRAV